MLDRISFLWDNRKAEIFSRKEIDEDKIKITYLGKARVGAKARVILTDYHAG